MKRNIAIIGATGLTGRAVVETIRNSYPEHSLTIIGRSIPDQWKGVPELQFIPTDFTNVDSLKKIAVPDVFISTFGTTIAKAGTKEEFKRIDYGIPLLVAKFFAEQSCPHMILLSAIGAHPQSLFFYNRVKGELEQDLIRLPFQRLDILRPSLLLGKRHEFRWKEHLIMPLMKALAPVIPWNYKPVPVTLLARKIIAIIDEKTPGVYFHQGKSLFHW